MTRTCNSSRTRVSQIVVLHLIKHANVVDNEFIRQLGFEQFIVPEAQPAQGGRRHSLRRIGQLTGNLPRCFTLRSAAENSQRIHQHACVGVLGAVAVQAAHLIKEAFVNPPGRTAMPPKTILPHFLIRLRSVYECFKTTGPNKPLSSESLSKISCAPL